MQITRLRTWLGTSTVWQRTLVACLVMVALVLIPGTPSSVRILAAWLLVCLMPGLLIWDLVFRTHDTNLLEALPLCFALSLACLIPITVPGFLLHLSISQLVLVFHFILAALVLANCAVNCRRSQPALALFPPNAPKIFTALVIVTLGVAAVLIRIGPRWDADAWYHLTIARAVVEADALDLSQVSRGFGGSYAYPLWSIAVALIARVASVDILEVWYYLPAILVPLAAMATYSLAYALFQSCTTASAAGLVYLAWADYSHRPDMPLPFLSMLPMPDVLSFMILFPLFLSGALRWAMERTWNVRSPLLLVCLGAPLAAIHNSQYFYALALLSGFAVLYAIIWRRDWETIIRIALIVALFGLVFMGGFEFARRLTHSETISSPLAIIEARNQSERADIDLLRDAYPIGSSLSWMLPALVLLFLAGREQAQRARAAFILTALLLGPVAYFDTPLLELALKTIPKLNRFAFQLHTVITPLLGGWCLVTVFTLVGAGLTKLSERYGRDSAWHYGRLLAASGLLGLAVVWLASPLSDWLWQGITLTPALASLCIALAALIALLSNRLYPQLASFRSKFTFSFWGRSVAMVCALTWLTVSVILPGAAPLAANLAQGGSWTAQVIVPISYTQVPDWWDDGLTAFLRDRVPRASKVLTECWPRWYLGALVSHTLQYDKDLLTMLDPRADLSSFVQILRTRNIDYILLTKGTSLNGRCTIDDKAIMTQDFAYLEPVLERYPAVFEKVYASSSYVLWRVAPPHTDPEAASAYWKSYEQYAAGGDQANALAALQLWTLFSPDPAAKCEALRLTAKYVGSFKPPAAGKTTLHTDDVAALQSGARVADSGGFSTRPAYSPPTAIDGNRFDGFAATYAGAEERSECPAWVTLDLGQPRAVKAVEMEWVAGSPVRAWQLDYRDGDRWQRLADSSAVADPSPLKYNLPQAVTTSQVRLTLTEAAGPGLIGLRRLSLYEHPGFSPPGADVALLSAGTTVEDHSPVLDTKYRIESALGGNELAGDAAVAGGPDQSYPHWFILNFNQQRSIYALEIQWYDRSYGQDWLVSYFDGQGWHPLKEEHGWQPPADYLYRYVPPQPIQASKIRLDVNWASGGRMVVRRFSVYGK